MRQIQILRFLLYGTGLLGLFILGQIAAARIPPFSAGTMAVEKGLGRIASLVANIQIQLPTSPQELRERVQQLLVPETDPHARDRLGTTPLGNAASSADIQIVRLLIERGADVNHQSLPYGDLPLNTAISRGDIAIVRLLIEGGADVNFHTPPSTTPMTIAAGVGDVAIVELMIEQGADVNRPNIWGYTPLRVAQKKGHEEIIQLLVENGAH